MSSQPIGTRGLALDASTPAPVGWLERLAPSDAERPARQLAPLPPGAGGWLRRFWPFARAHRGLLGLTVVGALTGTAMTSYTPKVMGTLVDHAVAGRSYLAWLVLLGMLGVGSFFVQFVRRYFGSRVGLEMEYDLRTTIYDHIQRLDFATHDRLQTGQLVSRAGSDVQMVQLMLQFVPTMASNLVLFALAVYFMLTLSVEMTCIALVILPVIGVLSFVMRRRAYPSSWDVQQQQAVVATVVEEAVTGVRVVKGFGQERRELDRLTGAARSLFGSRMRNVRVMAGYGAVMGVLPSLGQAAVFGLGGWLVLGGHLTLGSFLAVQTYLIMLIAPVRMTTTVILQYQQARAGGERLLELLDSTAEVVEADDAVPLPRLGGRVSFSDVSFGYLRSEPVLRHFDLEVAAGETVAVVGGSGSGKSTLAALLPRFYDPQEGAVLVDGVDVRSVTLESLRGQIGVVFEEAFLFSDTVRANIAYGRPEADIEAVMAAARAAEAHEFIMALPDGYDTVVGERGLTLSGGQRQRVALARALLTEPEILLLDDATSSIDVATEAAIHSTLGRILPNRTALLIAHRRSTIELADRIVVLDGGRVLDSGTHAELTARCPLYCELLGADLAAGPAVGEPAPAGADAGGVVGDGELTVGEPTPEAWPDVDPEEALRVMAESAGVRTDTPRRAMGIAARGGGGGMGMGPLRGGPAGGAGYGRSLGVPPPELKEKIDKLPPIRDEPQVNLERERRYHPSFNLAEFVRPYRRLLVVGGLLIALQAVVDLVGPYITRYGLDHGIVAAGATSARALAAAPAGRLRSVSASRLAHLHSLITPHAERVLLTAFLAFVAINLFDIWAQWADNVWNSRTSSRLLFAMRVRIFSQLQRLGLDFYDREMGGRVMTRMTSDINNLSSLLNDGILNALVSAVTLGGVIVIMLTMNLRLALATMASMVPLAALTVWYRNASRKAYSRVRERLSVVNAAFQESISGVRVAQAYTQERRQMSEFGAVAGSYLASRLQGTIITSLYFPAVSVLQMGSQLVVLGFGIHLLRERALSAGALIAFVLYISTFFSPIQQLSQVFDTYQQAGVSMRKIRELMAMPIATPAADDPIRPGRLRGEVSLEEVAFTYPNTIQPALNGVTLHVRAGETVALVGQTGAGKSTVVKLIARFYDPDAGRVLVDGMPLAQLDLEAYRQQLGYVPQEPVMFTGTVRDNIAYGRPEATDFEVERAARAVGAHSFVAALPFGYRTPVTERGRSLSAGQRQLIALARAYLVDPAILLLDEATANLDLATEARVSRAMSAVSRSRTAIVIAHRLQTAREADRIIVLGDGRVIEEGSHDQLVAAGGHYARQWTMSETAAVAS
ncbi:MAG TPA: ABC transporter ATP-binding protein [Acidimicrobiales bacterium]|nr:ABC transporter ATP-binding protein [Acidimicrobiales bacterium]